MEEPKPSVGQRIRNALLNNLLTILLVTGVVLGIGVGFLIRGTSGPMDPRARDYVAFPGMILIRLLKLSATPLIIACIVVALSSLDLSVSKTLGWQFIVYVIVTKIVSAVLGLVMAIIVHPGRGKSDDTMKSDHTLDDKGTIIDIFLDMFRNIIPGNMVRIYLQQQQTKVIHTENSSSDVFTWDTKVSYIDGMNLLGMVFTATLVGLCFTILANRALGFLVVVREIYQVSMKLAVWTLWIAPVCLFFLILTEIMMIDDFGKFFSTWGIYILTVNGTFLIQVVLMHPLILLVIGRVNIIKFYKHLVNALVTAYVTSSSMASLPVLIECLLAHGIDPR
ncbi:hypothetical protein R5R35_014693 [Gryllus longicercus]|uniref:Amino acid transporter n=1 Tax=Gryllus longicercus TaxID=2509291 RepID=A0AAN9YXF2_9ORTH